MKDQPRFAIVGGGIAGLTIAIALQRRGFSITVYESAPVIKPLGAGLTLAGNAVKALFEIGIADAILREGKIMKTMRVLNEHGEILAETDAELLSKKLGVVNNFSIHRADLHNALMKQLEPGTVLTGKSLVDFEQTSNGVEILFADGASVSSDYVIACDGIHSVVRKKLLPGSTSRYAGYTCWRAVIDATDLNFESNITSETWGRGSRFGIVPLTDNKLYWFACLNANANDPLMKSYRIPDLLTHFGQFHHPVSDILKHTPNENLIWNDILDIKPLTRFAFGNILLTGDAAHATTPNLGQGACMAIEDAAVLANALSNFSSAKEAFVAFEKKRIKRTTKIVNTSRKIGTVAQWQNPVMAKARNMLMSLTPSSFAEKQARFLTEVNFM